jgi:hypothetical protein
VGKKATNAIAEHFANAKTIIVPQERKNAVRIEQMINENVMNAPEQHMMTNLTIKELEDALGSIKKKKFPGKGGITNEMLTNLGKTAKTKVLPILNLSWKRGIVPQIWKDAIIIPIKKCKDPKDPISYRPISLLSCLGKLLERIINNRLM